MVCCRKAAVRVWHGATGAEWGETLELVQLVNLRSSVSAGGRVSEMDVDEVFAGLELF